MNWFVSRLEIWSRMLYEGNTLASQMLGNNRKSFPQPSPEGPSPSPSIIYCRKPYIVIAFFSVIEISIRVQIEFEATFYCISLMPIISRCIWGSVPSYRFLLVVFRLSGLRFRDFLYLVRVCLESKEISPSYNRPFDRSVCLYQSVCFVRRTAVLFLYSCFVIFFKHIRTLRIDS